jgi:hypothetical protein
VRAASSIWQVSEESATFQLGLTCDLWAMPPLYFLPTSTS